MPDNLVDLINGPEWAVDVAQLAPLWKAYGVRVAMQANVNGFPWGLLPALGEHGIDAVWMGSNGDTSVPLTPTPEAWWWEGPDGKRTLVWSGKWYCFGYGLFHAEEWRRGPPGHQRVVQPALARRNLGSVGQRARHSQQRMLGRKLAAMDYYRHPVIAFQVTNMWRIDNDPPSRQLADFVKAWNASGRKPRLVMSTPSRFLARLRETAGPQITTVRRGDWPDWWSDGVASTPELLAATQQAKRVLADLPAAARLFGAEKAAGWRAAYDASWDNCILFDEHTWGSYWSIAQPYHRSAIGGAAEKAALGCRAAERAALARTALLRGAKDYCDFSRTRRFRVLNPGATSPLGMGGNFRPRHPLRLQRRASWPPARPIPWRTSASRAGRTPTRGARRSTFPTTFGAGK